jgi:hypothetical protein
MAGRITDNVIDALHHCRMKAYLHLHGNAGGQCGYEKLMIEQRANVQRSANAGGRGHPALISIPKATCRRRSFRFAELRGRVTDTKAPKPGDRSWPFPDIVRQQDNVCKNEWQADVAKCRCATNPFHRPIRCRCGFR